MPVNDNEQEGPELETPEEACAPPSKIGAKKDHLKGEGRRQQARPGLVLEHCVLCALLPTITTKETASNLL